MARAGDVVIDSCDLYSQVVVNVTVRQRPVTSLRLRVALALMRLAGWIAPYGVEVDDG